jgi:NADH dehydrogenase [ubiquinone] 1 alpha subcomplex assembly factor 7
VSETPLGKKLRLLIEANGPMSVADYMAHCLGDPQHGYYTTRDPFGIAGDFITAPEVSQMFGEIVGAWLIEAWRLAGSPSPVQLVELGPGRGTLMADILRVATRAAGFRRAVAVHLVETSPVLKARQAETLRQSGGEIAWHLAFNEVTPGPLLLVANEFFDALPIRQFVRTGGAWRERVVGLDSHGRLAFGIGPAVLEKGPDAIEGSVLETVAAGNALMMEIAARIVAHGGAALVIDYGYATPSFGDSLQAMRGHAFADPLAAPGEADLTAHVDFTALAAAARVAAVHGPIAQRDFLLPLGLLQRASRLGANADMATRDSLAAAVDRLAGTDQMGTLFKVLAITRPGVHPPPFPAGSDIDLTSAEVGA